MRVIHAERLVLEPQLAAHADEMFALLDDPALYVHENEPPPSREWLRARFARLESRHSPDQRDLWLNWVIRASDGALIGYVQATVHPEGRAAIGYVLGSAYWGRGRARTAVAAMLDELRNRYDVGEYSAVLRADNARSRRLLEHLGFAAASAGDPSTHGLELGEMLMHRVA